MNAYGRNSKLAMYQSVSVHGGVASADPHRLVLMLIEGALERLAMASGCMERGEVVKKTQLLHRCITIIAELRGSLNLKEGGPLAQNLSDLYEYMTRRLLHANASSDAACVREVMNLLTEIRSAWVAIGPEVRHTAQPAA